MNENCTDCFGKDRVSAEALEQLKNSDWLAKNLRPENVSTTINNIGIYTGARLNFNLERISEI